MKKLFSYILLLAMVLSLFAGCAPTEDASATPDLTGLEKAKTYLFNLYKDSAEVTVANFDVVGVVVIQGYGTYNVTWSADSDAITFTPKDKMVTVNIPVSPEAEINYVLTATLSDDKGNTETVTFNHKVPAGGNLADGTYVILAGNLTMSSLTQDKSYGYPTANEVTVADGKVSNHFKADVLTITKVGDHYTIQDAYGRYFYLKGTYNSFNVDATMPTEGHLFSIGREGEFYTITNTLNQKTLAYSTSYTSWGCYPELAEDHQYKLIILPATAPATDPTNPDDNTGDNTGNSGNTGNTSGMITSPATGVPYKLSMNNGKDLYFMGVISKDTTPWYMKSSENVSDAIDVYLEAVTGGYRLYFTINGAKTYLVMYKDGTHYSLKLTTEPSTVYTWNTQYNTLVAMNEDKECFIGTTGTYTTFSCNTIDKASNAAIAHLFGEGGSDNNNDNNNNNNNTPSTPSTGNNDAVTSPAAGTAYKMVINQTNLGKTLYFTGVPKDNQPWYIQSSENVSDAIDVYLESVSGGYRLYFTINGAKNYLVMYKDGTHYSLKVTTEASTVYTWNTQYNTLVAMNVDAECYIGTYNTYNTFSCSKLEKIEGSFPAYFIPA